MTEATAAAIAPDIDPEAVEQVKQQMEECQVRDLVSSTQICKRLDNSLAVVID